MTTVPAPVELGREPAWWGMILLVATEATLFALLLAAYFYTESETEGPWPPPPAEKPTLLIPIVMTVVIASSSIPVHLAARAARLERQPRTSLFLLATIVLGLAFLALQAYEYSDKLDLLTPRSNAYGSLFYTITGLHGAHVAAGLVMLAWALGITASGGFRARRSVAVDVIALYWHFVHAVWLVVFTSLYLIAAL